MATHLPWTAKSGEEKEIAVVVQYEKDSQDRTWSNRCGFGEFTTTNLPGFCAQVDEVDEMLYDLGDSTTYDLFTCTADHTHEDIDPQPYEIGIHRTNNSEGYVADDVTIILSVVPDCTFVIWEDPVDPTDTFFVPLDTAWTPDRNTEIYTNGEDWNDECNIANIDYPGLQDWISIGSDYEITISPYLVSHMHSNTLSIIKQDPGGKIADLTTDLTFEVDVHCDLMPYKEIESFHEMIVAVEFVFNFPNEHAEDVEGGSWTPYCDYAVLTSPDLPSFCLLEPDPADLTITVLTCMAEANSQIMDHDFEIY